MKRQRKTLTLADAAVVAGGLVVFAWLQVTGAEPAEKTTYLVEKKIETFDAPPRQNHRTAAAAYEEFNTKRGYFGAFASAEDGSYGWADNHSSQGEADRMAMAECAMHSNACHIITRLRPEVEIQFDGITLSQTQAMALDRFHTLPNHKAIALSSYGRWGAAWNRSAPFAAKQGALQQCRANIQEHGLEEQGGIGCRLVVVPQ